MTTKRVYELVVDDVFIWMGTECVVTRTNSRYIFFSKAYKYFEKFCVKKSKSGKYYKRIEGVKYHRSEEERFGCFNQMKVELILLTKTAMDVKRI